MRILYVTPAIRWPLAGGFDIRQWNVLTALRKCGEVDVVVFQPDDRNPPAEVFAGCGKVVALNKDWLTFTEGQRQNYESTFGRMLLTFGTANPFQFLGPPNERLARWFAHFVVRGEYDVVFVVKAATAVVLGWRDPSRTILDGDDFEFVREYLLLRTTGWYGAKVLNYLNILKLAWRERQLSRWFSRVARCSEQDRKLVPGRNTAVIPNGAPTLTRPRSRLGKRVLFVGFLGYAPNGLGMEWFLEHVWPRVRRQVPGAELDVVGREPSLALQARDGQDGLRVHGFVKDITQFWENAALSIAPLLAGGGTRLKILESLAYGVPVVSTSVGAYGLDLGRDEGLLRSDQPNQFADDCVAMLTNGAKATELGERGKQAIADRYSWESVQERVQAMVREVQRRRQARGSHKGNQSLVCYPGAGGNGSLQELPVPKIAS